MICTKRSSKGNTSSIHIFQLFASFNATQIISLLYLALVINLFIASCLPSLSAQQPLFRADASYAKQTSLRAPLGFFSKQPCSAVVSLLCWSTVLTRHSHRQLQTLLTSCKTNRNCFHPPWAISFKDVL